MKPAAALRAIAAGRTTLPDGWPLRASDWLHVSDTVPLRCPHGASDARRCLRCIDSWESAQARGGNLGSAVGTWEAGGGDLSQLVLGRAGIWLVSRLTCISEEEREAWLARARAAITPEAVAARAEALRAALSQPPRPKGTDEVADVSSSPGDGELHGGDGNSAECDHASASAADGPRERSADGEPRCSPGTATGERSRSDAAASPTGGAGQETGCEQAGGPSRAEEQADSSVEAEPGDATGPEAGMSPRDVEATPPDGRAAQPARGEESRDEAAQFPGQGREGDAGHPKQDAPTGEEDGEQAASSSDSGGSHSFTLRRAWGGVHARVEDYIRGGDRSLRRQAINALRAFVDRECGTHGDTSPRLDGRRLVRELASRRYALGRCLREEQERRRVLVLVDVSGSCSASCGEALSACQALACSDSRVLIVTHSNGWPVESIRDGRVIDTGQHDDGRRQWAEVAEWWSRLIRESNLARRLIVMGDGDGSWVYEHLCSTGHSLIWLDSYSASRHGAREETWRVATWQDGWQDGGGAFRECRRAVRERRLTYWTGCNSARDFIDALTRSRPGL